MEKFILQCFEEYKSFMSIQGNILPNIIPIKEVFENEGQGQTPWAYINADEIYDSPRNLYYSSRLEQNNKTFIKAILFHEYTHLLDESILSPKYSARELHAIMSTYSEYHASQIELACKVGFKNIHLTRKINLKKTFVPYENDIHNIEKDYIHPMAEASMIIDKSSNFYYNYSAFEYYKCYKSFEAKIMYYLGKKNFCKKYSLSTKFADITQKTYNDFYPIIHDIELAICKKNLDILPALKNQLLCRFISSFPLKESELEELMNAL